MIKLFLLTILIISIIFITLDFAWSNCKEKIVYKFIPRSLDEQEQPLNELFGKMFTDKTPWNGLS